MMSVDGTKKVTKLAMVRNRIGGDDFRGRIYRRRFLVPNAVTLGGMFCGFLAVIYSSAGKFDKAAVAIGIAILLDGLDGRVARRLKATSKFGVEFDSFSDFLSFGVGPAALVYHWSFRPLAESFGVALAFVFALCAATRLARFNIQAENLKSFSGLPTPGAAGMVAAWVNFAEPVTDSMLRTIGDGVILTLLAYLMISKIEYLSIKKFKVSGAELFIMLGAVIALLWYNSQVGFLVLATGYVASGPVAAILRGSFTSATVSESAEGGAPPSPTSSDEG